MARITDIGWEEFSGLFTLIAKQAMSPPEILVSSFPKGPAER